MVACVLNRRRIDFIHRPWQANQIIQQRLNGHCIIRSYIHFCSHHHAVFSQSFRIQVLNSTKPKTPIQGFTCKNMYRLFNFIILKIHRQNATNHDPF